LAYKQNKEESFEQKKRTRTMRQATQTQPLQLAAVAFAAALEATDETTKEQPPQLAADSSPAALGSLPPELWDIFLMNSPWVTGRSHKASRLRTHTG
jgi:hypothetical protein